MSITICYPYVRNPIGGSFESVKLLIDHLDRKQFYPIMVFGVEGSATKRARDSGITTDVIPLPKFVQRQIHLETGLISETAIGLRLLPYLFRLRGYIRNSGVDIVHVNDGLAAVIWGLAAQMAKIPVIWHVRSERPNVWDMLRIRLVNQLIFVANSNRRKFKSRCLENIDTTVIHNGVDIDDFWPGESTVLHEELGVPTDTKIVGFVGNLVHRKRPLLFVNAAMHALKEGCPAHFVIVGKDQGDFSGGIETKLTTAGVEDRVHQLGYRSDIPDIMRALDLLVLTSTAHGEAFPRVPLEAMASGTPVVTTDSAGVSEAVIDGETGRIVDPGISPGVLGALLNDILVAGNDLERWGQNGVERVHAQFDATDHAGRIEEVYLSQH